MQTQKERWIEFIKGIDVDTFRHWYCIFFLAQEREAALHGNRNSAVCGSNGNNLSTSMLSLRRSARLQNDTIPANLTNDQPTTGLNQSQDPFLCSTNLSDLFETDESLDPSFTSIFSQSVSPIVGAQSATKRARTPANAVSKPKKRRQHLEKHHYDVWHQDDWFTGWGASSYLGVGLDLNTIKGKPWRAKYKGHQRRFAFEGDAAEHIYRLKLKEADKKANKNLELPL